MEGESKSGLYSSFSWKLHLKPEPADTCHTTLRRGVTVTIQRTRETAAKENLDVNAT